MAICETYASTTFIQEPAASLTAPFEIVTALADETQLIAKLQGQAEGIWLDGDVLWLAKNSPGGPWKTIGGVEQQLTQIDDSNLWAVGLRWNRWSEVFLKVAFLDNELPEGGIEYIFWRGDRAPAPPAQAEPAKTESFQLPGPDQGAERTITVVLPPGYKSLDRLPAILLADGQSAEAWGKVIAALVLDGKARPLAVVGVHSGKYQGDRSKPYDPQLDLRACEYLEGYDHKRFTEHLSWVIDTVLPEVSARYAISLEREDLAVAGFSNGGAFAATAAIRRSDVFGMALALSVGVPPETENLVPNAPMARFYLAAGELEHNFLHQTTITSKRVIAAGGEATMVSFVAGHDAELWTLAVARLVPKMFPVVQK